jgi:hypothetical protein
MNAMGEILFAICLMSIGLYLLPEGSWILRRYWVSRDRLQDLLHGKSDTARLMRKFWIGVSLIAIGAIVVIVSFLRSQ